MLRVSVIIPCHNEEAYIERKVKNTALLGDAVCEIIIVDDYSNDQTYSLIKQLSKKHKNVIAMQNRGTRGKNFAMQKALQRATGTIICMTDADILLEQDTLKKVLPHFLNEQIGGACLSPKLIITNKHGKKYVNIYECFVRTLKIIESKIDSVPVAHGQALFFRKDLDIIPTRQADDVDIAIQIRKKGKRVKYIADCFFLESVISNVERLKNQKIRRSKAVIDSLFHHKEVFFNPRYGFFGFFCYPVDLAVYIFSPLLFFSLLLAMFSFLLLIKQSQFAGYFLGVLVVLLFFTPLSCILSLSAINIAALKEYIIEQKRLAWDTERNTF